MEILKKFHSNGFVYGNIKPSNIIIKPENCKQRISLINRDCCHYINKVDKKENVDLSTNSYEKPETTAVDQSKSNYFTSSQILKKERIDYKSDLESLFYVLYYLFNNGKMACQDLTEKKLLLDQINLSIHKEKLIERLGSIFIFFLHIFIYH